MRYTMLLMCLLPLVAWAQSEKNVTHQRLVWVRYQNQLTVSPRLMIQSEIDNRMFVSPLKEHHLVMRTQGRYTITPQLEAGAGFTFALQHPQDPRSESDLVVPELRLQHDITLKQMIGKVKLSHRYLVDERFIRRTEGNELADGYNFNFRLRYRLQAEIPVWKAEKQEVKVVVHDEAMLNFGKTIKRNVFDQNRIYAGVQWGVSPSLAIELGYLKWYQQRQSGIDYFNRDIARLSVFHKVKLTKNDK